MKEGDSSVPAKASPRSKGDLEVKGNKNCKGMKEGNPKNEDCPNKHKRQ